MNKDSRNPSIDILKGICIIFVIISHSDCIDLGPIKPYIIDCAVPIFMMVSGYLYYISFNKYLLNEPKTSWKIKKIIRFLIPYILAFLIEIIIYYVFTSRKELNMPIFALFLTGGIGPGSYYTLIMIEFIIIYPIIYKIIKKYKRNGLIICFAINLFFEIIKTIIALDPDIYRLLIFRYIFVIAYGSYLSYTNNNYNKKISVCLIIIGALYIFVNYKNIYHPVIMNLWNSTSMISSLFWIPMVAYYINNINISNYVLERIGISSYNIFLTQMVYFFLNMQKFYHLPSVIIVIVNIFVCCLFGYIFYLIENKITKYVLSKVEST